jgi:hypothetical protein
LGVTTTPEQAASASASSRMTGPAFCLIRMACVPPGSADCRAWFWAPATGCGQGRGLGRAERGPGGVWAARPATPSVRKARLADGSFSPDSHRFVNRGGRGRETAEVAKGRGQDRRRSENFPHSFNEQNERGRQAGPFASPVEAYWARYFPIGGNTQLVRLDSET